ncbi:hypothetical protein J6590_001934 [Homalodisca vitripennis]|nr:hypothetical protein J6590_001934 [Homalodisca vitripennis]
MLGKYRNPRRIHFQVKYSRVPRHVEVCKQAHMKHMTTSHAHAGGLPTATSSRGLEQRINNDPTPLTPYGSNRINQGSIKTRHVQMGFEKQLSLRQWHPGELTDIFRCQEMNSKHGGGCGPDYGRERGSGSGIYHRRVIQMAYVHHSSLFVNNAKWTIHNPSAGPLLCSLAGRSLPCSLINVVTSAP